MIIIKLIWVLKNIFWVPKPIILKWPLMWVLDLRLIIHLRLSTSPMDYLKMNLHAIIAYRFWFSLKGHPNYILIISKWPYMWVLHLRLGLHLKLPKSLVDYIKTNLNMGIAFRAKYSYNFAIPTNILIFINSKFGLNFLNN
jgi:hypothetical protein